MCQDPALLEFYDNGLEDMHSFIASKMYPELKDLSLKEIKESHKDRRQESKIAGFVINYGGAPNNIADQLNKSIEDGERVFNAYFQAFPGLKTYFSKVKADGVARGYIAISERTNRKCYVDGYEEFRESEKEFTRAFWTKYRSEKEAYLNGRPNDFQPLKEKVSEYFKTKGALERKSLNYPIQGQSAEITKLSGIFFFKWIKEHGLLGIVKAVNQVHDENVIECPSSIDEIVKNALAEAMVKAGELYCTRVPLKVDPSIVPYWEK